MVILPSRLHDSGQTLLHPPPMRARAAQPTLHRIARSGCFQRGGIGVWNQRPYAKDCNHRHGIPTSLTTSLPKVLVGKVPLPTAQALPLVIFSSRTFGRKEHVLALTIVKDHHESHRGTTQSGRKLFVHKGNLETGQFHNISDINLRAYAPHKS